MMTNLSASAFILTATLALQAAPATAESSTSASASADQGRASASAKSASSGKGSVSASSKSRAAGRASGSRASASASDSRGRSVSTARAGDDRPGRDGADTTGNRGREHAAGEAIGAADRQAGSSRSRAQDDSSVFISGNGDRSYDDLAAWFHDLQRSWFGHEP